MGKTSSPQSQFADMFQNVLKEFGTSVPQISVLVAIFVGTFGLPDYFNAGVWTVVATVSFVFVYAFKRHISPRFTRVAVILGVTLVLCLSLGFGFVKLSLIRTQPDGDAPDTARTGLTTKEFMKNHVYATTAYLAAVISIHLAIFIVSHKNEEALHGRVFPPAINQAIEEQLVRALFYKTRVENIVQFSEVTDDSVVLDTKLRYEVVNRSEERRDWIAGFTTYNKETEITKVVVDNEEIYVPPQVTTLEGYSTTCSVEAGAAAKIELHARVRYGISDFELYTTYHPATDLSLLVSNPPENIDIRFEWLYGGRRGNPVHIDNDIQVRLEGGVLNHQGIKMIWRPAKKNG